VANTAPDSPGSGYNVRAAAIAACAGCTDPRRRDWADAGLLRKKPPFQPHDAAETAILYTLAKRTNKNSAPQAWRAVRHEVRQLVMSGKTDLWIVMTKGGQSFPSEARVVDGAADAAEVAEELGGLVWLVHVADAMYKAKERFEKLVKLQERFEANLRDQAGAAGNVTSLRARTRRRSK
jgi:hypothetical protein